MSGSKKIVLASKGSILRWSVLALIVICGFSVEYLLKRDINKQVGAVWMSACAESLSTLVCAGRVATHHRGCFDLAYTSMIFTFGRERWDSFKLIDYEACMNRESVDRAAPIVAPRSEISI